MLHTICDWVGLYLLLIFCVGTWFYGAQTQIIWAISKNKLITSYPTLKLGLPKRTKPQTTNQIECHLGFEDKLIEDYIRSQDPCQVDGDKTPSKLPRENSRRCEIVQGSLLKLPDESTITSTLITVNCLAQSYLMLNDRLEQYKKSQKSPFMMIIRKSPMGHKYL